VPSHFAFTATAGDFISQVNQLIAIRHGAQAMSGYTHRELARKFYDINTTQLKSPDMNKFLC
jgi:hypothetical protein